MKGLIKAMLILFILILAGIYRCILAKIKGNPNQALLMGIPNNDLALRSKCRGALGEHGACLCSEDESKGVDVTCINAQFVDIGVVMYINEHYDSATSLTFHGNNFQELPDSPLFGQRTHYQLKVLNLSANYIVNLNSKALISVPNLEVLDLSNNEIVLTKDNIDFLSYTPLLTHLYLRRAFAWPTNRTVQFEILEKMFERANLKRLKVLNLSYNFISSMPYNLACPFPSLSELNLRQNLFRTFTMNTTCLQKIQLIDLSSCHFHDLSEQFRSEFADKLPSETLSIRNSFYCDCKSYDWIRWLKNTNTIANKSLLVCDKASPSKFTDTSILKVPLDELDCRTDLYSTSTPNFAFVKHQQNFVLELFITGVLFLISYLI